MMEEVLVEQKPTSIERDLVGLLRAFNRKERFMLVAWAVDRPTSLLGEDFRRSVQSQAHVVIPQDAFAAMDYHLTWLHASLVLMSGLEPSSPETALPLAGGGHDGPDGATF